MLKNLIEYLQPCLSFGDLFEHLFKLTVDAATFKPDKKPSIGRRILPVKYKKNPTAVVLANISVWVLFVVIVAVVVAVLS